MLLVTLVMEVESLRRQWVRLWVHQRRLEARRDSELPKIPSRLRGC